MRAPLSSVSVSVFTFARTVVLGTVALAVMSGCALLGPAEVKRDEGGNVVESADASVFALKVGDCLNTAALGEAVETIPTVPCSEPHDSVVIAELTLTDEQGLPGSGTAATDELVDTHCADALAGWTPTTGELTEWSYNYILPTAESWANDDRLVQCVALRS